MAPSPPGPLLTVRAAVVVVLALNVGVLAGALSFLADPSVPVAVLCGSGAAGTALLLFHTLVEW